MIIIFKKIQILTNRVDGGETYHMNKSNIDKM